MPYDKSYHSSSDFLFSSLHLNTLTELFFQVLSFLTFPFLYSSSTNRVKVKSFIDEIPGHFRTLRHSFRGNWSWSKRRRRNGEGLELSRGIPLPTLMVKEHQHCFLITIVPYSIKIFLLLDDVQQSGGGQSGGSNGGGGGQGAGGYKLKRARRSF